MHPYTATILLYLTRASTGHSWVDDVRMLGEDGSIVGDPGYVRGNVPRVLPSPTPHPNAAFNDFTMQNLIPPTGRSGVTVTGLICKSTQQTMNMTAYSPMLRATASDRVLLRYQENGHVTLRDRYNSGGFPMKPISGSVWVYGTDKSTPEDTLMGIHGVWDEEGTGGDGRVVLLTSAPFDDGMCYQVNDSEESARRQALPQRAHTEGEGRDLWCGVEVELPSDLTIGSTYTLYWVWE